MFFFLLSLFSRFDTVFIFLFYFSENKEICADKQLAAGDRSAGTARPETDRWAGIEKLKAGQSEKSAVSLCHHVVVVVQKKAPLFWADSANLGPVRRRFFIRPSPAARAAPKHRVVKCERRRAS